MGRGFAYAYKAGQRPYGQPADGFHDSSPRPQTVGSSRNIQRMQPMASSVPEPEVSKCSSLTRDGAPCKGRPVGDGDLCVFHRE